MKNIITAFKGLFGGKWGIAGAVLIIICIIGFILA